MSGTNTIGSITQFMSALQNNANNAATNITSGLSSNITSALSSVPAILGGGSTGTGATTADLRVRLKGQAGTITTGNDGPYGVRDKSQNIMAPLYDTQGMVFPYSPQINFVQDVDYSAMNMVQSNMDYYTYTRTPSVTLSVSGKFTVQSQYEGIYALACIHFLRTSSKMYFGQAAVAVKKAGLPPPVLLFDGYGTYMFNNLKVILKSHSFNYEEDMDTVLVHAAQGNVKLPAMFTLSCTLVVQQTPSLMRTNFDLDKFRTGALMRQQGWI